MRSGHEAKSSKTNLVSTENPAGSDEVRGETRDSAYPLGSGLPGPDVGGEQARVAREIDAHVRRSLARGTEDLWKRLREVVSHIVDRLNEPDSSFHGSLVTNVFDLDEILPRLNVQGDEDLNRFAEQVKQRLCNYSAQDLKKHDLLRVTAAADAANIVA